MEHAVSLVILACNMARVLESNLPHVATNPYAALASCEDVAVAFNNAVAELRNCLGFLSVQSVLEEPASFFVPPQQGGSTSQRTSMRRRESGETRTVQIPALHAGNMELPPDDGYTWRKYGQKDILGSRFPRSYYRCTHKNFGCDAKKKVQRLDQEPCLFEITYCGQHTCQTSPVALENFTGMGEEAAAGQQQGSGEGSYGEGSVADFAKVMFCSGSGGGVDALLKGKQDEVDDRSTSKGM
ncbi:hypothetical protein HPP92_001433 [Vanilla planifolia]|uniref:WRKY domain-containing protein n=1 Tax=Vanilla planifolia TaxID=51239 RepID=A0A835S480_VANPL|nr:hypothetical protein HPP92_001433 [Vanilla planifolia]